MFGCFVKFIEQLLEHTVPCCPVQCSERLASLGLESLQVGRLKCDLIMCYKIIHCNTVIQSQDFVIYSDYLSTRGISINCLNVIPVSVFIKQFVTPATYCQYF